MREFVKDGTVEGFELWDPGKLGYLAGYAAAALASGRSPAPRARRSRPATWAEDRRQGRGPARPADRLRQDNIDDFDF